MKSNSRSGEFSNVSRISFYLRSRKFRWGSSTADRRLPKQNPVMEPNYEVFFQKRLQKELISMQTEPMRGVSISSETLDGNSLSQYVCECIDVYKCKLLEFSLVVTGHAGGFTIRNNYRWIIDVEGADGTLYQGEKFQLLFKFSPRYPFDSPEASCSAVEGRH